MVCVLLIAILLPLTVSTQDDPCNYYSMLYDDGGRSINCDRYYSESHDRFIDEGWRRVQLQSTGEDLTMPTQCVPRGYCGSHSNVWLNGTHPTVEDGIVDRMGCLSMFSSCCKIQYPIQIKNCTDYMVYNLMRTLSSDERYCFGDSNLCYHTSTTTTSTTTKSHPTTSTTKRSRQTTSTTKKSRQTTSTTKKSHHTTPTNKKSRPTAVTSTTKYGSSSTVINKNNHEKPSSAHNGQGEHGFVRNLQQYETDELVLILGVCLSVTIALLITFVVGILFYLRQRKIGPKYILDTKPTKA